MNVQIAGTPGQVQVEERETFTSISTGRELRRLEANVTFVTPRDDALIAALKEEEPTLLANLDEGPEVPCRVRVLSSSYTEGESRRRYRLELEELEQLNLERLAVAGIDVDFSKICRRK